MATTSSIGTSSRNYSTIAAWIAAFTTGGWIGQCYNDTEFTIVAGISFSGQSTSAANFIQLTTATGQSFADTNTNGLAYNVSNGVGIKGTLGYSPLITVSEDYVSISKIQLQQNGAGNGTKCIRVGISGATHGSISQTIQDLTASFGASEILDLFSGIITNSVLIIDNTLTNGIIIGYGTGAKVANCTIVRTSNNASSGTGITSLHTGNSVINTAVFGFSSFCDTVGNFSGSNNATDLASVGFGSSNQTSLTYANQFVTTTASGRNFQTKTGANLLDNGATDTTDIPAAIDIFGTSRPQGSAWDIGAHELMGGSTITASASFTGSGVLAPVSASTAAVSSSFSGSGLFAPVSASTAAVTSAFSGTGTFAPVSAEMIAVSAAFSGSGLFNPISAETIGVSALFGGEGDFLPVSAHPVTAYALFGGEGDFFPISAQTLTAFALFSGEGDFSPITQSATIDGGLGDLPLSRKERERLRKKTEAFIAKQERSWQEQLAERRELRDSIMDSMHPKKVLGIPKLPEVTEDDDEEAEIELLLLNI